MTQQTYTRLNEMIIKVATALGPDILQKTAFVGGVTTGLLLTDELVKESVRSTDDVDLIISALGYYQYNEFEENLRERGFTDRPDSDVICRKWLGDLQVDFMPTDESLGFTNRWYKDALERAQDYKITPDITIRLLTPPYFLATKFEAFRGRGNNDLLESRDIEDIVNLINGLDSIVDVIREEPSKELVHYISAELKIIKDESDFDYVLQSATNGDSDRIDVIYEIIDKLVDLGG
jgi:predicted nucleotidyltransferase